MKDEVKHEDVEMPERSDYMTQAESLAMRIYECLVGVLLSIDAAPDHF